MAQKILSLAIGIPAYNEQEFLPVLIKSIKGQKLSGVKLTEVVVLSDASTDQTDTIVTKLANRDARIVLSRSPKRIGKGLNLNRFFKQTSADVAVVLDADVRLLEKNTLQALIQPILDNQAQLTSGSVRPLDAHTWVQHALTVSFNLKDQLFIAWNHGDNIYTCHGRARAFAKKLYRKLRFIDSIGEDAYSYLVCKQLGLRYQFAPQAKIYFELPKTFADHAKQSIRFSHSQVSYFDLFDKTIIEREYALPKSLLVIALIKTLATQPIPLITYILIMLGVKLYQPFITTSRHTWQIATSSKTRMQGALS